MTIPYSSKESTCFNYFSEEIDNNLIIQHAEEFKKIFKLFYKFIKDKAEIMYFLKNSSDNLIQFALKEITSNKKFIVSGAGASTNLTYFKHKYSYIDILIKIPENYLKESNEEVENKLIRRFTKKVIIVDKEKINRNKIKTSVRAN